MIDRKDVSHETIEGIVTGIEDWEEVKAIEVNGRRMNIVDLIVDNLPADVKSAIWNITERRMVHPGYKIQIFLDLKVKVVRE